MGLNTSARLRAAASRHITPSHHPPAGGGFTEAPGPFPTLGGHIYI